MIPETNLTWINYLTNNMGVQNKTEATSGLSMQFLGALYSDFLDTFIVDNIYDNQYWFNKLGNNLLVFFFKQIVFLL
ncbi:hypothetical protein [Candidatus Coxiella mudrowiae]|uniref:hypothetical protein n=1 Tax=Candidatus Coxiella mudrowiae TaxID=2054173 RepID=UPI0012FF0040|nr:hypothetical protein [Candidatus Coxiella mudrowiae]